MIPCSTSSTYSTHALTLLLTTLSLLPGCIDPKSVGQESDEAGDESGETGDTGEPTTDGSASNTSGNTTQGPGTDGSETDTDDPGTGSCPPIDYPACVVCECIDGEWSCSEEACDCAGKSCGDACLCAEGDPACTELDGICTAEGQCVGVPPPKLGFCEGALLPGFEGELTVQAGCSDMTVYAHDAADERAIVVSVDQGLVQDAVTSGLPTHAELSALDAAVYLEARAGFGVTVNECNDVIMPDEDIKETWLPTAGMVIVDVVPDGMGTADATVELVGVELSRVQPGPAPITVDMTLADVYVGWLPG